MMSSNTLSFEKNSALKGEHNEVIENDESQVSEKIMYMPTLPSTFKSIVGKTVKVEMEDPQYVIELLGDLLGVTDYKTNKAAFWFLDTIALQVLRYRDCLDDHYMGVLISWLAGEMKLIRDKKFLREDFFKEMRILFHYVVEKLSIGDQLLHWDLLVDECSNIISKNPIIDESAKNEAEYLVANTLSKNKLMAEDPNIVLDIIVEATYSMYANDLRYALIYEVFVTPIQIQIFHMPHTLRVPRKIKVANSEGELFDIQLRKQLEKATIKMANGNHTGKKNKGKKTNNTRKEQTVENSNTEIPSTPCHSLLEEELLIANREFILPLIEAQEATQVFEMHAKDTKRG